MDANSHKNLGAVLRYMALPAEDQQAFVKAERDRIAKGLRAARTRVKASKAANGGDYRG